MKKRKNHIMLVFTDTSFDYLNAEECEYILFFSPISWIKKETEAQ